MESLYYHKEVPLSKILTALALMVHGEKTPHPHILSRPGNHLEFPLEPMAEEEKEPAVL